MLTWRSRERSATISSSRASGSAPSFSPATSVCTNSRASRITLWSSACTRGPASTTNRAMLMPSPIASTSATNRLIRARKESFCHIAFVRERFVFVDQEQR